MSMRPLRILVWPLLLASCAAPAAGQDSFLAKRINEAIDQGIIYLKSFSEDKVRGGGVKRPAAWALRGWALLEAGVAAGDAVVQGLAAYVRQEVPSMTAVYDIALSIIFLDKLQEPSDEPLIESLAVRLLAGQGNKGGWNYEVDPPHAAERARLAKVIEDTQLLKKMDLTVTFKPRTPQEIAQDVSRQARTIAVGTLDFEGDNSNTQFAMMAAWVARRHGLPVQRSMEMVEKRFQVSQLPAGAWGYIFPARGNLVDDNHFTYPAMTCAGLLGLALGQGVRAKPADLAKDSQVQGALAVVARALDAPPRDRRPNFHYFLFSMERFAVVYNLTKIGTHDWYEWGAAKLVDTQSKDGSWSAGFPQSAADTCFALLFLRRANVARDLTTILEAPARKGGR